MAGFRASRIPDLAIRSNSTWPTCMRQGFLLFCLDQIQRGRLSCVRNSRSSVWIKFNVADFHASRIPDFLSRSNSTWPTFMRQEFLIWRLDQIQRGRLPCVKNSWFPVSVKLNVADSHASRNPDLLSKSNSTWPTFMRQDFPIFCLDSTWPTFMLREFLSCRLGQVQLGRLSCVKDSWFFV